MRGEREMKLHRYEPLNNHPVRALQAATVWVAMACKKMATKIASVKVANSATCFRRSCSVLIN